MNQYAESLHWFKVYIYGLATTKVVQPEKLIDVKSNYQNFNTGSKNDSANRNYLVTRILGWPKGAPILKDYLIGIGWLMGIHNWGKYGYSKVTHLLSCEYFIKQSY